MYDINSNVNSTSSTSLIAQADDTVGFKVANRDDACPWTTGIDFQGNYDTSYVSVRSMIERDRLSTLLDRDR